MAEGIIIIAGLANILLSFLVLLQGARQKVNYYFAFLGLLTAFLMCFDYYFRLFPNLIILQSAYAIGSLLPMVVLLWSVEFIGINWPTRKKIIISLPAILFSILSFLPNIIVKSITELTFLGYRGELGIFFPFYTATIFIYTTGTVYFLWRAHKKADLSLRHAIRAILFGVALYATSAIIFSLILPSIFGIYDYTLLDAPSSIFFVFFSFYAIVKYRFFNIKVVATELLTFAIWGFLLTEIFLAKTTTELLIGVGLLFLVVFFGIFLIRSVLKEVRQREEIQDLAEQLQKANIELKKLDQLKSEFVSLASHQLRTPLTVIKGYISMIQEGSYGAISEQLKDALRKIYISNETLINLVGDFLNLSRIESGRMKYMFEATSAEEMMEVVFEEFKEIVKEKKLELTFEKPPKPLAQVMLDKDKFKQVLMNLVDNAVKYTKAGTVKLKVAEEKGSILISVSDSGVGMTKEDMESIFKRFSRGEEGSKVNTGGLGLGLYLAKRIVTDHGGDIWATSEGSGKGSTFWVKIPKK